MLRQLKNIVKSQTIARTRANSNVVKENTIFFASAKEHIIARTKVLSTLNERHTTSCFIKMLLKHMSYSNIVNKHSNVAMFVASAEGQTEILRLLLDI